MRSEWALLGLVSAVATIACVAVLVLRGPMRRLAGANAAYALWVLPPLALLATLIPAPPLGAVPMQALPTFPASVTSSPLSWAPGSHGGLLLSVAWLAGAITSLWAQWRAQRRFMRGLGRLRPERRGRLALFRAQVDAGLPAVVGLWRPRIVLPDDFERRYEPAQRALLLRHELVHLRRGDAWANAVAALLRAAQWFNPVVLHAYGCFRRDQELACDASVMAARPYRRGRYAEAMVRASQGNALPLACPWSAARSLRERIGMLKSPAPGRLRRGLGGALALSLAGVAAGGAWAVQPSWATPAAGDGEAAYRTDIDLIIGGEHRGFTLIERAGRWMSFTSGEGEAAWRGELRWQPLDARRLQLEMTLRQGDEPLVRRKLTVERDDAQATVEATGRDGKPGLITRLRATPAAWPSHDGATGPADAGLAPPRYPPEAYARGIAGRVVLLVDVRADGSVAGVAVEHAEPRGVFDATAVAAARRWYFKPALANGKPVAGRVRVPVQFDLRNPGAALHGAMP